MWKTFLAQAGGDVGPAPLVKRLRIAVGQQGIFRDLEVTRGLSPPTGVAVGVRHTGTSYDDDYMEDGLLYHYPETERGRRDEAEIESIRAAGRLGLPVFVVVSEGALRRVRPVIVEDEAPTEKLFLMRFVEIDGAIPVPPQAALETEPDTSASPFFLDRPEGELKRTTSTSRPSRSGQLDFKFRLLRRYGKACVVCGLAVPHLLEAAHIKPFAEGGSDHSGNGLLLCRNHHRAFDKGLFSLSDQGQVLLESSRTKTDLRITVETLSVLPHPVAVTFHRRKYKFK
jgi:hypothetical protein